MIHFHQKTIISKQKSMPMADTSRKKLILTAAEKVMGMKGINARISEIAIAADVNDSIIYHYFKNKEDLLFSVAEQRLKEAREQLEDQLCRITDPESKLRQLISFRLKYLQNNRDYAKLLMFECRSNLHFYKHPTFDRSLWFLKKLGEIIKSGMECGDFAENINIWLVQDTVFGLLDILNIQALLSGKEFTEDDFKDVMDLILPIVRKSKKALASNKKLRIISAAERIFAKKGYESAKIQDISRLAGVADGTVYDHFKNKEDLLFSVLQEGFHPSSLKRGFQAHLTDGEPSSEAPVSVARLQKFIRRHFLICLTQPSYAKILILHGIYNKQFYSSASYSDFDNYMNGIYPILDQGKTDGSIRSEVNNRHFKNLILGAFSHITLRWLVTKAEVNLDKIGEINKMVQILTDSVVVH